MYRFLGTGFYTGLSPIAPGTVGSLVATAFIWGLSVQFGLLALLLFLSFWMIVTLRTASWFEKTYGKDPSVMVSDEWAGQVIPFMTIPFSGDILLDWWILLAGFLLFRFFDILKPFGINKLQKLKGGFGILFDDILAGIYALVALKLLILFVH
jgi:phosphatidylglycerophosphatase A